MSTISLTGIGLPHQRLRWRDVKHCLVEWRHWMRSRDELMTLSDRCLQDIGMSRSTSVFDVSKPFWMA